MNIFMNIPFSQLAEALEEDSYLGFCLECGAEAYWVEPDAREYECEACGARAVYGAEELLLMGTVDSDEQEDKH
jgi:DNA-directed RNA polymerase subunit RPC12/RpoP